MTTANLHLANQRLGPCGLHCGKCFAFEGGDIHRLSAQLEQALGNFAVYAERFQTMLEEPVFAQYPAFREFLHYLTTASCRGCRQETCKLFKGCRVRLCSEEQGVDFCVQCSRFPCGQTGFDPHLEARHVAINERIREIGADAYYDEIKDQPRY